MILKGPVRICNNDMILEKRQHYVVCTYSHPIFSKSIGILMEKYKTIATKFPAEVP